MNRNAKKTSRAKTKSKRKNKTKRTAAPPQVDRRRPAQPQRTTKQTRKRRIVFLERFGRYVSFHIYGQHFFIASYHLSRIVN